MQTRIAVNAQIVVSSDSMNRGNEDATCSDSETFGSTTYEEEGQTRGTFHITVDSCESPPLMPNSLQSCSKQLFNSRRFAEMISGERLLSSGLNMFSSMDFSSMGTDLESTINLFPGELTYTNHEKFYSTRTPTELLPSLFLGSREDSLREGRLKELGITHILMVASGHQHPVPNCKLLTVPMADNGNTNLYDIMDRTFKFIKEGQSFSNKLLVHCNLGQNRSPTLVIAWLMQECKKSLHDAYTFVKEKRDLVQPHTEYIQQLRILDKQLHGVYSVKPNFLTMSVDDGELLIMDENWTKTDSTLYQKSQLFDTQQLSKSNILPEIDELSAMENRRKEDGSAYLSTSVIKLASAETRSDSSELERIHEYTSKSLVELDRIILPQLHSSESSIELISQNGSTTQNPAARKDENFITAAKCVNAEAMKISQEAGKQGSLKPTVENRSHIASMVR